MNPEVLGWGVLVVVILLVVFLFRRANQIDCESEVCTKSEVPSVPDPVVPVKKARKSSKKTK